MNRNQKLTILAGCVAVLLLCAFPPVGYEYPTTRGPTVKDYETFELVTDIRKYGKVMTADLGFRILVVAGLTFAGFRVAKT